MYIATLLPDESEIIQLNAGQRVYFCCNMLVCFLSIVAQTTKRKNGNIYQEKTTTRHTTPEDETKTNIFIDIQLNGLEERNPERKKNAEIVQPDNVLYVRFSLKLYGCRLRRQGRPQQKALFTANYNQYKHAEQTSKSNNNECY